MTTGNRVKRLDEVINGHIDNALEQLRVAQPGLIEKYDDATGLAEVVPLLKRPVFGPNGAVTWLPLEKLIGVPVVHLAGGRQRIKLPVEVARSDTANIGDVVLLIFCDFGIDGWKAKEGAMQVQGVVQPATLGAHQVADAIAIAGLFNPLDPSLSVAIEVKSDGSVLLGAGASQGVGLGQALRTELDALWAAVTGHTHAVATTGTATAQTGVAAAETTHPKAAQTVESATVKTAT